MRFNLDKIQKFYEELPNRVKQARQKIQRPLTLTEKILFSHVQPEKENETSHLELSCDWLAMHDVIAPSVLLQYASVGKKNPAIPTSVHCDHLITAESGRESDLKRSQEENDEIFIFLQSATVKFGCGFWLPGSGMMAYQLLEHTAFPGGVLLGSESSISFLGCLGMLAFDATGVHALDAMVGLPYVIEAPKVIGVKLTGTFPPWTSSKDAALKVLQLLQTSEAKGAILEFFGPGADMLSVTDKATICSLSFQGGALSSIFSYSDSIPTFLHKIGRPEVAEWVKKGQFDLTPDLEVLANPNRFYSQVIEINLSDLKPTIVGPQTIEILHSLDEISPITHQQGYPEKLALGLIGSSTNSSYEDIKKAALLARQALKHGLKVKVPILISPGSENIFQALKEEGLLKILEDVGAVILASTHGPCSGLWRRQDVAFGERNSIITSFNCNSPGHCDSNPGTYTFISSPEIVMALALAGTLHFNPLMDSLLNKQGLPVRLHTPENNLNSYEPAHFSIKGFVEPSEEYQSLQLAVDPLSERLQPFEPFKPHLERSFSDLRLLVKIDGKCTIDHISPAGKWIRFRGHLDHLSNNLFSLAPNSFRDEIGRGKNLLNNCIEPFAKIARDYKKEEIGWIAVGFDNYGEGVSREHAAIGVRHLGGKAVIAKSFSTLHEDVLKKQGVLTLTFSWPADSAKIREDDFIDLLGAAQLAPGSSLELLLKHSDGTTDRIHLTHSYSEPQIAWFRNGSLLNMIC